VTKGFFQMQPALNDSDGNGMKFFQLDILDLHRSGLTRGEFQVELPDGRIKKLYLFSMIFGYSRKIYTGLIERCDMPSFLDCHIYPGRVLAWIRLCESGPEETIL